MNVNTKIEEQFNLIAKEYDVNRRKFIPCFDDFYETSTSLILSGAISQNAYSISVQARACCHISGTSIVARRNMCW